MNLLKSRLRRTTAALAGPFIGLAGAVAFAAPASAHESELTGETSCLEDGGWTVDWTLTTKYAHIDGTIKKVEEAPDGTADLKNIKVGATVPLGESITDSQTFGKDVAEVKLAVVEYEPDAAACLQVGRLGALVEAEQLTVEGPRWNRVPSA